MGQDYHCMPVIPKLFLIAYHFWVPDCHHVPPCARTTQFTKYDSIESLKNLHKLTQMRH